MSVNTFYEAPRVIRKYVGRLHRDHEGKSEVVVYDYADESVPVLARMAAKRRSGYRALGYVATAV